MASTRNPIKNIVFGGVGVDGTAYVGALQQLEKEIGSLKQIRNAAGTSSGSIMALLVALNCTAAQIAEIYNQIDFAHIANDSNVIRDAYNILVHESLYNNAHLRTVITNLFVEAIGTSDITFEQLQQKGYKNLTVVTTRVCMIDGEPSTQIHLFSADHTPKTQIITAIMASAAIPGIFPMICLAEKSPGEWVETNDGCVHIDGGFVNDLPIGIFDRKKYYSMAAMNSDAELNEHVYNPETLALMVYSNQQVNDLKNNTQDIQPIRHHQIGKILYALGNGAVFGPQMKAFAHRHDVGRTVLIDNLGVSAVNFKITVQQKAALIEAGAKATALFYANQPLSAATVYTASNKSVFPFASKPITTDAKMETPEPVVNAKLR